MHFLGSVNLDCSVHLGNNKKGKLIIRKENLSMMSASFPAHLMKIEVPYHGRDCRRAAGKMQHAQPYCECMRELAELVDMSRLDPPSISL